MLSEADGPLGVSELGRRLGLGKSTVHATLAILREHRYVDRRPQGRYVLGLRPFEVGSVAVEQRVSSSLMPRADQLARETGEAVSLAVLDGDRAVVVRRVESTQLLRAHVKVGTRMRLDRSASGRVLLAYLSNEERSRLQTSNDSARSAADGDAVPASGDEIEWIRAHGYAISRDELVVGVSTIATPVFGPGGGVIAALSLAAPSPRFEPETWVETLLEAGRDMSTISGGAGL